MLSLGIDSGSTTTKAILFDGNEIVDKKLIPTSANPQKSIKKIYDSFEQSGENIDEWMRTQRK